MVNLTWTLFIIAFHSMAFIFLTFGLYLSSKLLKFKRRRFLLAVFVSFIFTLVMVLSSLIGKVVSKISIMAGFINVLISWIVLFIISIILMKKYYKINWKQIILVFLILFALYMVLSIITLFVFFTFFGTELLERYKTQAQENLENRETRENERVQNAINNSQSIMLGDFEINEYGEKVSKNNFIVRSVYRVNNVISSINQHTVVLSIPLQFTIPNRDVSLNMDCHIPEAVLFNSMEDHGRGYWFESYNYSDLDFHLSGLAYLECPERCNGPRQLSNNGYRDSTKLLFTDSFTNAEAKINLFFKGEHSIDVNCRLVVISKDPPKSFIKRFDIQYIGNK